MRANVSDRGDVVFDISGSSSLMLVFDTGFCSVIAVGTDACIVGRVKNVLRGTAWFKLTRERSFYNGGLSGRTNQAGSELELQVM